MKLRTKFVISNILMLITPILLIGVISVFFIILFVMMFPMDALALTKFFLLDFEGIFKYFRSFLMNTPMATIYFTIWLIMYAVSTVAVITYITSRLSKSIIPPISSLTQAAEQIKEGNFDCEILYSSDEEINRLCMMFDQMRLNLKTVTQRERKLRRDRSMMLANLSHDIKTPLTAIKGYVDGIKDGVADSPDAMRRYLDTIYQKADMIESMIDSLSAFSKLEMDKIRFSYKIGDIYAYVRNISAEYMIDAQKIDCTLSVDLPERECLVKIDYEMLHRVFANLIGNSMKYRADNDSCIKITSSENDDGVLISIADNGIGMADEELDKIFDSFYRIDSSRSAGGSGLGLAISRQIVENHGGKLWFRSGLQQGSEAVVYLPKADKPTVHKGEEINNG